MKTNTLSDKKHNAIVDELKYGYFFPKDVKDFIKKLKEEFEKRASREPIWCGWGYFIEEIDKLAGDALIHSSQSEGISREDTPEVSHSLQGIKPSGTTDKPDCKNCGRSYKNHHSNEGRACKWKYSSYEPTNGNKDYTNSEKCYLCGKTFRGSINSIQRQKARHLGGGRCAGVKSSDNKECANCGEPEHIHPYSFGLGKSCDKFMIKKLKGEKKKR